MVWLATEINQHLLRLHIQLISKIVSECYYWLTNTKQKLSNPTVNKFMAKQID